MISFAKILVGVDLSHADRLISHDLSVRCEQAVQKGIALAQGGNGKLTFTAVIDISEQALHLIETDDSGKKSKVQLEAEEVLGTLVERAKAEGVDADAKVLFGPSAESMIKFVEAGKFTLVVVGRKSKSSLTDLLFGRTAIKLLRKCPVPVYVAKPDPARTIESTLVADDFTEVGEQILDAGVQLARMFQTRLHVVHVVESGEDYKLAGSGIPMGDIEKLRDSELERAKTILQERLSRTDYRTLELGTVVHVEQGSAEKVICDKLRENEVDLLVMGTAGRTGLSAMIMGNTAERILAEMDCSLLAIKPKSK
ncbi:MAG: universal stress protein [Planctomycetaceae bacterium]|nr:universal stress protein [Planctomycetaceae bacterium]